MPCYAALALSAISQWNYLQTLSASRLNSSINCVRSSESSFSDSPPPLEEVQVLLLQRPRRVLGCCTILEDSPAWEGASPYKPKEILGSDGNALMDARLIGITWPRSKFCAILASSMNRGASCCCRLRDKVADDALELRR